MFRKISYDAEGIEGLKNAKRSRILERFLFLLSDYTFLQAT